jgi:hypothetical protein
MVEPAALPPIECPTMPMRVPTISRAWRQADRAAGQLVE